MIEISSRPSVSNAKMFHKYFLFVFSSALICLTDSAPPPSSLTICKSDDAKCITKTAADYAPIFAKGLPEFKVPVLDPTHFKQINASQPNLLFVLTDVTAAGLGNCEPKKIERDAKTKKMKIQILCSGTLDGQYELSGRLLVIPIEGQGAIHVDLRKALVNIELQMENKQGDDGEVHWQIKTWSHNFELKDKSDVKFENLYKDNEVLGRAARELVANNGNDIVLEIGPPVMKTLIGRVVKYINYFFKAIPAKHLSLD